MISELLRPYRRWCRSQGTTAVLEQIIAQEQEFLGDSDYLLREVIGHGEFDWDFRCLDEGFLALVRPSLSQSSGSLPLFQSVLHELDADTSENRHACLFVEFGHYATLINDFYTFHPDLVSDGVEPRRVSLLTQLRYAGQYLSMYPRYLLVSDKLVLSDAQQIELHEALAGSVVIQGASRGVALKWGSVLPKSREHYLQHCINTIHSYVVFPVVLACLLAGVDRQASGALRVALGHLALAMKLGIEREALSGQVAELSDAAQCTASLLSRPGLRTASNAISCVDTYDEFIDECLGKFSQQLIQIGLLEQWGHGLAHALSESRDG